jgi:hypothetical protein
MIDHVMRGDHNRRAISALVLAVPLFAAAPCAQAQVYTCIEDGKKVFRQQPCAGEEPQKPAPAPFERFPVFPKAAGTYTPVFGQAVVFTLPAGWKPGFVNNTRDTYMMEFVPQGQTVQAWREMITLQGFRGAARNPKFAPRAFLAALAARIEKACGATFVSQSLGDTKVDSFDAHTAIIGCGNLNGQGEIAYHVAIKGTQDVYLIHRAFRGASFSRETPPLSAANVHERAARLLEPIKICERAEPQAQCWDRRPR